MDGNDIDNVRMISRVTGDPLPGDTLLNPNNTGPDFDVYGTVNRNHTAQYS